MKEELDDELIWSVSITTVLIVVVSLVAFCLLAWLLIPA